MLGMLYSRKKSCMRHILEGLKRHVRGHVETCLLIIFSSRGCVIFSHLLSNFLGGCPNHEKIKKTCTFGWYPEVWLSRHGLTFHGVGWWERARWVRTEQQNVHRSRLGAKSMIHSCKMRKPKKTKKKGKQENQENQEDLLGQGASDIGLCFFVFLFLLFFVVYAKWDPPKKKNKTKRTRKPRNPRRPTGPECLRHSFFFWGGGVCNFACPKAKIQRVESCHWLVFLSVNAYVKTENVQRGMQKAHSGDPLFWKSMGIPIYFTSFGHQIHPRSSPGLHLPIPFLPEDRRCLGRLASGGSWADPVCGPLPDIPVIHFDDEWCLLLVATHIAIHFLANECGSYQCSNRIAYSIPRTLQRFEKQISKLPSWEILKLKIFAWKYPCKSCRSTFKSIQDHWTNI